MSVRDRLLPCVQAARAASSAAVAAQQHMQQEEAKEPLPAFGSGMQFRPTKKVKQQGSSQAPQRSAAVSNRDDEMEADDGMHDEMEDADMQPVTKPRLVGLLTVAGCLTCFHLFALACCAANKSSSLPPGRAKSIILCKRKNVPEWWCTQTSYIHTQYWTKSLLGTIAN